MAEKLNEILSHNSLIEDTAWDFWSIPFEFLGVANCNADECANFSTDVSMKLEIKSEFDAVKHSYFGQPLSQIYMVSIFRVLKKYRGNFSKIEEPRQRRAVETLINFIQNIEEDGNHTNCLRKLQSMNIRSSTKAEAHEIQAVMASHLFSPLLTEGKVIVDKLCCETSDDSSDGVNFGGSARTTKAECPFCKVSIKPENTNFGVKDLWHGRADIVIKAGNVREAVTVTVDEEEEDDDEGCCQGPVTITTELTDDHWYCPTDVKTSLEGTISTFVKKKAYKEAISQTLLNAFLGVKNNKNLEDTLIPSFLVCQNSIFINFYNVKRDYLLVQSLPMKFVYSDGNFNYAAFICIWMALNFHVFPSEIHEKLYCNAKKSGFEDCLKIKGVLEKYRNEISDCFSFVNDMKTGDDKKHVVSKKLRDELHEMYRLMEGEN